MCWWLGVQIESLLSDKIIPRWSYWTPLRHGFFTALTHYKCRDCEAEMVFPTEFSGFASPKTDQNWGPIFCPQISLESWQPLAKLSSTPMESMAIAAILQRQQCFFCQAPHGSKTVQSDQIWQRNLKIKEDLFRCLKARGDYNAFVPYDWSLAYGSIFRNSDLHGLWRQRRFAIAKLQGCWGSVLVNGSCHQVLNHKDNGGCMWMHKFDVLHPQMPTQPTWVLLSMSQQGKGAAREVSGSTTHGIGHDPGDFGEVRRLPRCHDRQGSTEELCKKTCTLDVLLWRWFGLTAWIYNQVESEFFQRNMTQHNVTMDVKLRASWWTPSPRWICRPRAREMRKLKLEVERAIPNCLHCFAGVPGAVSCEGATPSQEVAHEADLKGCDVWQCACTTQGHIPENPGQPFRSPGQDRDQLTGAATSRARQKLGGLPSLEHGLRQVRELYLCGVAHRLEETRSKVCGLCCHQFLDTWIPETLGPFALRWPWTQKCWPMWAARSRNSRSEEHEANGVTRSTDFCAALLREQVQAPNPCGELNCARLVKKSEGQCCRASIDMIIVMSRKTTNSLVLIRLYGAASPLLSSGSTKRICFWRCSRTGGRRDVFLAFSQ